MTHSVKRRQNRETPRLTGVIKTIFPSKGYGFIHVEGGEGEYWFHSSAVVKDDAFADLSVGDSVTFIPTNGKEVGQLRAVGIRRR